MLSVRRTGTEELIHLNKAPECSLPELVLKRVIGAVHLLPVCPNVLGETQTDSRDKPPAIKKETEAVSGMGYTESKTK